MHHNVGLRVRIVNFPSLRNTCILLLCGGFCSSELLQAQRWHLKDHSVGSVCSTTELSNGDSLKAKLCGLEVEEAMPPGARMVMNDRSNGLYYASRDAKAWAMTYEGAGFSTKVKVVESLWEWDVLLCLGLNVQSAACLKNAHHKFMLPHQTSVVCETFFGERMNFVTQYRVLLMLLERTANWQAMCFLAMCCHETLSTFVNMSQRTWGRRGW
eukprot:m.175486 g.175486  ORF g.175486 m.175486 type:complete len:213 (-) comp31823_c0_seq1:1235-1873(-)